MMKLIKKAIIFAYLIDIWLKIKVYLIVRGNYFILGDVYYAK